MSLDHGSYASKLRAGSAACFLRIHPPFLTCVRKEQSITCRNEGVQLWINNTTSFNEQGGPCFDGHCLEYTQWACKFADFRRTGGHVGAPDFALGLAMSSELHPANTYGEDASWKKGKLCMGNIGVGGTLLGGPGVLITGVIIRVAMVILASGYS